MNVLRGLRVRAANAAGMLFLDVSRPKPDRPRWKLSPSEVPPELADNFVVRYLADLSPEQEAAIERAEALDAALGDGRPDGE